MSDFDINRISAKAVSKVFRTLLNPKQVPIKEAIKNGAVKKDTELLVVKLDAERVIAFSKPMMGYYHFAEGYLKEQPYMLAFCIICNSGMVLNPEVNGKMLHFVVAGVYNGMVQMMDKETGSYWDHITGECLHGEHKGAQLEVIHAHLVLTAEELATHYPTSFYGLPDLNFFQRLIVKFQNSNTSVKGKGFLPPMFRASMSKIDDRLPEMEMGLGIWEAQHTAKYYTIKTIKKRQNFIVETFMDRPLLIYISPTNGSPNAIYIDSDITVSYDKDRLTLSNGNYLIAGQLYAEDGTVLETEQPSLMFSRWYGFVSMFPDCVVI